MYKRNQTEAAILKAEGLDPETDGLVLRVRLKRLLDLDRKHPVGANADNEPYAFYSAAAPGTGFEVLFSSYEVFALWVGLRLLGCELPQGRVVFLLRYYRTALEREHSKIMAMDLSPVFKKSEFLTSKSTEAQREKLVREGRLVEHIEDMVFLLLQADPDRLGMMTRKFSDGRPTNLARGGVELLHFLELAGFARKTVLAIELTNPAHQLAYWLAHTPPARRGRR